MSIAVLVLIVGLVSDKQKVVDQKHLNMNVCTKNVTLAMILCFYFLINFLFYYSYAFSYCLRIAISYIFNNFYLCYLDIYPIVTIILPYFQVYFILFINIKKNESMTAGVLVPTLWSAHMTLVSVVAYELLLLWQYYVLVIAWTALYCLLPVSLK